MTKGSATSPPTLIIFSRVAKFIIFRYRYFLPINIVYNLITVIINEKKKRERVRDHRNIVRTIEYWIMFPREWYWW